MIEVQFLGLAQASEFSQGGHGGGLKNLRCLFDSDSSHMERVKFDEVISDLINIYIREVKNANMDTAKKIREEIEWWEKKGSIAKQV